MTPWKSVYQQEDQKIYRKFQHMLIGDLIPLANTLTPDLSQYH